LKKHILNVIKFFLFLALGLTLLYFAFKGTDLSSLLNDLVQAQYGWLALTAVFGIISHISRAIRWKILIAPLGYTPKTSHTFYAVMIGYISNLAAPRLGEVLRCGSLNKTDKIPFDALLGTVIVERFIDILMLFILTLVVFFSKINFFGQFLTQNIFHPFREKITNLASFSTQLLMVVFFILVLIALILIFKKKLAGLKFIIKISKMLSGVKEGLKSIYKMQNLPAFLFHTLLIWSMYFLTTWVVFFTLPETSGLNPLDGLFVLVIGSYGMVVPVQGGIGAYHMIVSLGLTLFGISKEYGLVYATIAHESQTLLVILLGGLSFLLVILQRKKSLKKNNF